MAIVHNTIGLRWENVLQERYPGLVSTRGDRNVPDFYHSLGFWIEAKAGNIDWGPRIKAEQLKQSEFLEAPIVYVLGMHTLDGAGKRIRQKTERGRQKYLERHMRFVETYFVSINVVHQIFEKEKRIDKNGDIYCSIKRSILMNILLDRIFHRQKKKINSSADYYGFDRAKYNIGLEGNVGYIFDIKRDSKASSFLLKD